MKILYYTWYENSIEDMAEGILKLGHSLIKVHIPFNDYNEDADFTENLEKIILEQGCDMIISFDFFPLIAKSADKLKIRYVSWIYDMPHTTVFSETVKSEYVSVFTFDRIFESKIKAIKPDNVYHMPLAVNVSRLDRQMGVLGDVQKYDHDISFVGSLYENNMYRMINYLPDYVKGYLEGIIQSQKKIYGYNLIGDALNAEVLDELRKYVLLSLGDSYLVSDKELYVDMINSEVTAQERLELLSTLADEFSLDLFTNASSNAIPNANYHGTVDYFNEMPRVFRNSKININITLRSIESGIPLRAMDVMGSGGFLLSNYQSELCEFFENGRELVCFDSKEDMIQKVQYYLEHEDERLEIARNGYEKVKREFGYEMQLGKILTYTQ